MKSVESEIKNLVLSEKYKLDISKLTNKQLKIKAKYLIDKIGFCVIENVIKNNIKDLILEIENAQKKIKNNTELFRKLLKKNTNEKFILNHPHLEVRMTKYRNRKSKLVNDIFWMPKFSKYLGKKTVTDVIKFILDDHIRIGQLHPKSSISKSSDGKKIVIKNDLFGLPRVRQGNLDVREWHTDWPHDPWGYGGKNKNENIGCLKDPFPDITLGIVVMHYLTDASKSGGTLVVPGSHKFGNSPRHGHISTILPIKGEHQIKAKAGSIFIQDTRLWHSSPVSEQTKKKKRVVVLSRWYPWWLQIDDYATKSRLNGVARPLSIKDLKKLPKDLRPYMDYLCNNFEAELQSSIINRTKINIKRSLKFFKQIK